MGIGQESCCRVFSNHCQKLLINHHSETKVINLNEKFDPVLHMIYRKRMEEDSLYPSFTRMDPVGGSPDLSIPFGG